ncbi:MAG TPA: hypothetical protein VM597_02410 [Gemmataceae bacterium]|nr:hypothetical protein [Gemmataceae bacterium]
MDEDVVVPAGTFKAMRLEGTLSIGGNPGKTTTWFAPGIGVVKFESEFAGVGWVKQVVVLKRSTAAK